MKETRQSVPPVPEHLLEAAATGVPRLVLLVGAGLSQKAMRKDGRPLPSWSALVSEMLDWALLRGFTVTPEQRAGLQKLLASSNSRSLVRAAGWLRQLVGKGFFSEFITEILAGPYSHLPSIHKLLGQLPLRGIVTFNYDTLLETALSEKHPLVATQFDHSALTAIHKSETHTFILKAHGDIRRPETIVFGYDDYQSIMQQNKTYRKVLTTLFEQNPVLVLGCGLDDPDLEFLFDDVLSTFSEPPLSITALVPVDHFDSITKEVWLRDRRVQLLEYRPSSPDHPEVDAFLEDLLSGVQSIRAGGLTGEARNPEKGDDRHSLVLNIRRELTVIEKRIAINFEATKDAIFSLNERRKNADAAIRNILINICDNSAVTFEDCALIARGGYGKGHLSSTSDIDITLLHSSTAKDRAEMIHEIFNDTCTDAWNGIGMRVAAGINTLEECESHWKDNLSSFSSFSFSRLIAGDTDLHLNLRKRWVEFAMKCDIRSLAATVRNSRLDESISGRVESNINLKYCSGGIMDTMLIHFLCEVIGLRCESTLGIRGAQENADLAFWYFSLLREGLAPISSSYVITQTNVSQLLTRVAGVGLSERPGTAKHLYQELSEYRESIRANLDILLNMMENDERCRISR